MPTYRYAAKRGPVEVVEGTLEVRDRTEALTRLAELGYMPIRVEEGAGTRPGAPAIPWRGRGISHVARNTFTRQFASLVRSQLPLLRALKILEDQTTHPGFKRVLWSLAEGVRQGEPLSAVMTRYPRVFPPLYVSLVRSGEASGTLELVLDQLAEQADHEEALRTQVQSALAYPIFVGVVGCGTVVVLMAFILPRLTRLFASFETLPWPTRVLMAVSDGMTSGWWWGALAATIAAGGACWRVMGPRRQLLVDRATLRLPILGRLLTQLELARFARALGLLLNHGVPILQAIDVALPVVSHQVIHEELRRLPPGLKAGGSLAEGLRSLPVATPFLINTVSVGEEGGRVAEALTEIANVYDREVERLLRVWAALLEPAMILLVGGLVGFITMAVLLPVFEMGSVVR